MFQRNAKKKRNAEFVLDPGTDLTKRNVHELPEFWGWIAILVILAVGLVSKSIYLSLPHALEIKDLTKHSDRFIGQRSFDDLKLISDIGPRVTGTYNNEVLGVEFLKREISFIEQLAHKAQTLEVDHQVVTGSYYLGMKPHGLTNMYQNVQNLAVKLVGENNSTLLLNCHFDSVAGSPGSSDDAASCCVMLEVLRVLSRQGHVNRHSIIFLFNGAEETPLQAAHGFITQHKWAADIKLLLNWESVGSNGKEMLFQTGPNNPWLVEVYGKSAPHPNAQVVAEELFQSGLIPSDTDFRIFRDFGNIVGLDFAHVINGYRYHTRYDHYDYLSAAVLQRTGDNCLELTKSFANSKYLDNPAAHSKGQAVFFDFCGLIFFNYSKWLGAVMNIVISIVSVVIPYHFLSKLTRGMQSKHVVKEILFGFLAIVLTLALSLGFGYLTASSLDLMGQTMSWYSNTWLILGLYCCPTIFINCCLHLLTGRKETPFSLSLKLQARLIGTACFHAILVVGITLFGYRSAYVQLVILTLMLVPSFIVCLLGLQNTIRSWIYIHIPAQILIILWTTQLYHTSLMMFIPLAGRTGANQNPDLMISHMSVGITVLVTSFVTPFILLLRSKKRFLASLAVTYLVFRFVLVYSGLDFPYRDETNGHPTPQRLFITHTVRHFYNRAGEQRHSDSGFWMREFDRNARKTYESLSAPGTPIDQNEPEFCKEVFCALPAISCRHLHTGSLWLPASAPLVRKKAKIELLSRSLLKEDVYQLNFLLSNEGVTSLQICFRPGVEMVNWNLIDHVPEKNFYEEQTGYFVLITHGTGPKPFNVTLDMSVPKAYDIKTQALLDMAVVTTHWEHYAEHTPAFNNLMAKVPKWAFLVPSVAAVDVFEY